jgi:DNA-binding LytR/AlgR family response regulator
MPGLTGVEAARQIAQLPPRDGEGEGDDDDLLPEIVFITAYDQYAVEAFEQGVADYVLKPAERERLQLTVERIRQRLAPRATAATPPAPPASRCSSCCTSWRRSLNPAGAAVPAVDPGQRRARRSR